MDDNNLEMGQWYTVSAVLRKTKKDGVVEWIRHPITPSPMMYIGQRCVYDGRWEHVPEEYDKGYLTCPAYDFFEREHTHKACLFVRNGRTNPVYVLAGDVCIS